MAEAVQTYVAQVGNVLTAMIVCVVVLMYVVFMELRPAVKEMQSEKEGYTARLTTCADSGLGNNTTQCWGDDSLMRGGRDGFLGYSEPPVFYDVGDLATIRKQQKEEAARGSVVFDEITDADSAAAIERAINRLIEMKAKNGSDEYAKEDIQKAIDLGAKKLEIAREIERERRMTATEKEKFSRYEKIHEGMKSDEDLLAMQ